eukprot:TRINITY_DN32283_c0_g1_i1.p1 TRINITY_DN32283_c0_g1~~TRINITY_DN32283_c0_g1_i1.p1  ORF type:complete len:245 (+),score=131.54 TRINITY_DN32283_c0_g1_i1:56-790(+)
MVKSALKKPSSTGGAKKKVSMKGDKKKAAVAVEKADEKKKQAKDKRRGVMYLGHVPHGYYEGQMRNFLSQYGAVKRLRLSRCKKSGKSKGYGFAQFEDPDVAEHAAEDLNGTFVTGKVMKCHIVPPEKVHADIWKGMKVKTLIKKDQDIRVNGPIPHYQTLSTKPVEKRLMDLVTKERNGNEKLQKAGIEYTFSGFEDQLAAMGLEYVPKAKSSDAVEKGVLATMSADAAAKKPKAKAKGKGKK